MSDPVFLITGASSGIGAATARLASQAGYRVVVDTPFFESPGKGRLEADDVARTVMFAVSQPPHVDVNEILVRPTAQSS